MPKFKWVVLYILALTFTIILCASFEAERFFAYASSVNISDKMMYSALTDNFKNISGGAGEARTYKEGDADDMITTFKVKLYLLGYMEYPTDNTFDAATKKAVENYQTAKAIKVNGQLDSATQEAINAEDIEYKEGHRAHALAEFQQTLTALGYLPSGTTADGNFTAAMKSAVESYQANNGLTVTGTINKQTQEALKRDVNQQTAAPSQN